MKLTFMETYNEKLEIANRLQLTRFVFEYENITYFVEWRKFIWSEPLRITNLG